MYIELHSASAFSFLEGASSPEALVERAASLGYPALALLDRDGVYGAPRFHLAAKAAGLEAIVGSELTIRSGGASGTHASPRPPQLWRLPVLVASRDGYRRLCRLITRAKMRAAKGEGTLTLEDLDGETGGLVALVGRAAVNAAHYGVGGLLDRVLGVFGAGNVYVELQRHFLRDQESDNQALMALAAAYRVPVVATNGVRFASEEARPLFDVLTCARHGTTVDRAGTRLAWNAERFLKPPAAMADLFADVPQAVAATHGLADRLQYTMADLGYRFPDYPVPEGETQAAFLRCITEAGARDRYRPYHDRARAQVGRELDLIEKLRLAGYFLIVWDIVNFCRQHGILVQGRGSAANSAVCYSLGITAVDPVGMDLLFERFLSEERGEWPDIDLDLPSGDRREQVIQYVYRRYGALGAAMTANVITYRGRSAAREVGKALGLDEALVDRLAKAMAPFEWRDPAESLARHLADAGLDGRDPRILAFADSWRRIQDLPRHLGQHSGGMVICQGRLDDVVPLEPASMPGRVVIQWDKEDCADMGIVKVDLLGLGMMAVLQDALTIINGSTRVEDPRSLTAGGAPTACHPPPANPSLDNGTDGGLQCRGEACLAPAENAGCRPQADDELPLQAVGCRPQADSESPLQAVGCRPKADSVLDLAHLPPDDPLVYRMLQEADTIGVFQVESRAQMATLPRIKPTNFYDLVVEVAIIRPGPIVGQMVHPYINRRNGRAPVEYPHPSLEPILKRTLGVPLFQEQLLRMAMVAAGFTGGEAEELRRAMGFKRSEARMRVIETKLRAGMARNGIEGEAADGIVRSITSFALYGFPESHAASFALIVYASAYLKAHYPAAFYTALLDNQPMGFYHPATLVKDAQRHGVRFASIDVQRSDWRCRVEEDGRVRLGLMYVRGLREEVGQRIASAPRTARRFVDEQAVRCPGCGATDPAMLERVAQRGDTQQWFCNVCARAWHVSGEPARFRSLNHFVSVSGARRDELATLAGIGALNAFGYDRRAALWQIEQAVRPAGELYEDTCSLQPTAYGLQEEHSDTDRLPPAACGLQDTCRLQPTAYGLQEEHSDTDRLQPTAYSLQEEHSDTDRLPPAACGLQDTRRLPPTAYSLQAEHSDSERLSAIGHRLSEGRAEGGVRLLPADERRPPRDEGRGTRDEGVSPLSPMTPAERVVADYLGTGFTIGPHPVALRRADLAQRGVLRAMDLPAERAGRRVRIAGAVITRQRPGTAKGFCFLTIEDETGIANVIVRPDLFDANRHAIVREPFILVEGVLQQQDGVTSVRAERVMAMDASSRGGQQEPGNEAASSRPLFPDAPTPADPLPPIESHDFH